MDQKQLNILLIVLLTLSVGYILVGQVQEYLQAREQKKVDAQNQLIGQGAQFGAQQTILTIAQQAAQCQQVPLIVGEQKVTLFAVECLERIAQQR